MKQNNNIHAFPSLIPIDSPRSNGFYRRLGSITFSGSTFGFFRKEPSYSKTKKKEAKKIQNDNRNMVFLWKREWFVIAWESVQARKDVVESERVFWRIGRGNHRTFLAWEMSFRFRRFCRLLLFKKFDGNKDILLHPEVIEIFVLEEIK